MGEARTETVAFATLNWVDWFNGLWLLEPIGNIPPAEAEERYYAMFEEPAVAACIKPNGLGNPGTVHFPPGPTVMRSERRGAGQTRERAATPKNLGSS